ncbi:sugar nucleotide-binding protein [Streptomyces sp. NBC_00557]|uniref:sugar nucleotide-binding protein n=1 Tax=Streptomyces sp. NBC_00557 TaxID=2975776 RepID=UPI003FCD2AEA
MTALGRDRLDIADPTAVGAAVSVRRAVVDCAAWTDVDGAEGIEAAATATNGTDVRSTPSSVASRETRRRVPSTHTGPHGRGSGRSSNYSRAPATSCTPPGTTARTVRTS